MRLKLKPVEEQVLVITGADSGIGLATARAAAERGARVVINSRDPLALARVADEIRESGGQAAWSAGDVADLGAMQELARAAIESFGRIDSWVNNAGVSVYGEIQSVPLDDARRLFETNYWGVVNGSLAALPHLKREGGALINVGSVASGVPLPLQAHYAASKHAVKGFTDGLRQELLHEGARVSVTLIRPASTDTPYTEHAHNHLGDAEPALPPPVYSPHVVAAAILACAEDPQRELLVGSSGKQMEIMWRRAPRLFDRYAASTLWKQQRAPRGSRIRRDALRAPGGARREYGDYEGHVMESSAYTAAARSPLRTAAIVGLVGAGAYWLSRTPLLDGVDDAVRTRFRRRPRDPYAGATPEPAD